MDAELHRADPGHAHPTWTLNPEAESKAKTDIDLMAELADRRATAGTRWVVGVVASASSRVRVVVLRGVG